MFCGAKIDWKLTNSGNILPLVPGDCCECGACCFSDSDTYVPLTESDLCLLGEAAAELTSWQDDQVFLKMRDGYCIALQHVEGDPEEDQEASGEWVCGIYAKRPSICRKLVRGSPACLAERDLKRRRAQQLSKALVQLRRPSVD